MMRGVGEAMNEHERPKETVILVHGTWAQPRPDEVQWYQRGSSFVAKLDAALERHGSSAKCWAHCSEERDCFSWSGNNSWFDRTRAAATLANYVSQLQSGGWRCHIVAHSHGGNVVAEALPRMTSTRSKTPHGAIVTLGTPFIDAMSPIARRLRRRQIVANIAGWLLFLALIVIVLLLIIGLALMSLEAAKSGLWAELAAGFWLPLIVVLFSIVTIATVAWTKLAVSWLPKIRRRKGGMRAPPRVLILGSLMDEAWQVLHHLRQLANPLTSALGLTGYLKDSRRAYLSRALETERLSGTASFRDLSRFAKIIYCAVVIVGAILVMVAVTIEPSSIEDGQQVVYLGFGIIGFVTIMCPILAFGWPFYSALWSPFRWFRRQIFALLIVPGDIGSYFARRAAWPLLQAAAMGLDGYRHRLPTVEREPRNCGVIDLKVEELPEEVEERALRRRNQWLAVNFGAVSETFSKMVVTAADISSLLRMVESDLSLVHAAYFTDDQCIDRIARWTAEQVS
jgi:hypothetical protein